MHIVICIIIGPVIDSMNANVWRALCLPRLASLALLVSPHPFALALCDAYLRRSSLPPSTANLHRSERRLRERGGWEEEVGGGGGSERCAGGRTSRYETAQGNKEAEGDASCERVKERKPGEGEQNENRRRGSRGGGR